MSENLARALAAPAPAAQPFGNQDMLARILMGNPDPGLPGYPVMQSAEGRGFAPMPTSMGDMGARMGAVLRGQVEPTPGERYGMDVPLGWVAGSGGSARDGIRAYHGSPHQFDRFDMSRIGTGEGAQAYGHGLYFAGNEGVARGYRDALAPGVQVTLNGSPIASADDPLKRVAMWIRNTGAHPDEIVRISEQRAAKAAADAQQLGLDGRAFAEEHAAIAEAARNLSKSGKWEIGTAPNGTMYEVRLNTTPDRLLDWDAPLSGKNAIRSTIEELGQQYLNAGSAEVRNLARNALLAAKNENLTGAGVYNQLTQLANAGGAIGEHLGPLSPPIRSGPSVASTTLREAGIDGIQYLDAGSRAAGDGTRNYVMFDDSLIDILRRYGLAGMLAGGAASQAQAGEP
ncbi:MAG: hypothetical protein ACK5X3_23205 [Pseudomonadota bacterium]